MRVVIVAALLATAALAHNSCLSNRGCSGIENQYGACTGSYGDYITFCGAYSHSSVDNDALLPVERTCMNIAFAGIQIHDTNGTLTFSSESSWSTGSSGNGVMPWDCNDNRQQIPLCTKNGDGNLTYLGGSSGSAGVWVPSRHDKNGNYISGSSISVGAAYLLPRQTTNMYYNGGDNHIGVSRETPLVYISLGRQADSLSSTYFASSEEVYALFRVAAPGGNPKEVSVTDGSRISANGLSFLEKAYYMTSTTAGTPSVTTYAPTWFNPSMKMVERYEMNYDTYKYEKRQFLAIKLTHAKSMTFIATFGKPGMDASGIAQVATFAAAAVAAVVAMMMATA